MRFGNREPVAAWVGGSIGKAAAAAKEFESVANVDGWVQLVPVQHLCFPPQVFPRGAREGSAWGCKECGSIWESDGCQVIGDYPEPGSKHEQALGPQRWLYRSGPKFPKQITLEQDLYDWRSVPFYNSRLLRRLIEMGGGEWKDV